LCRAGRVAGASPATRAALPKATGSPCPARTSPALPAHAHPASRLSSSSSSIASVGAVRSGCPTTAITSGSPFSASATSRRGLANPGRPHRCR
jgi:hypothetical protein